MNTWPCNLLNRKIRPELGTNVIILEIFSALNFGEKVGDFLLLLFDKSTPFFPPNFVDLAPAPFISFSPISSTSQPASYFLPSVSKGSNLEMAALIATFQPLCTFGIRGQSYKTSASQFSTNVATRPNPSKCTFS
jgi:hypothetical protein